MEILEMRVRATGVIVTDSLWMGQLAGEKHCRGPFRPYDAPLRA
jgi:hypothetical protein